jgi:hypothetical protein
MLDPTQVEALRQFLRNRGYHVPDTGGTEGSILKSALHNWSSGVHSRNPEAWNKANGRVNVRMDMAPGPHNNRPTVQQPGAEAGVQRAEAKGIASANRPHGPAGGPHPKPSGPAPHMGHGPKGGGGPPPPPGGGGGDFMGMLTSLLGNANFYQALPTSLADQIAAPDTAAASALQSQIDELPSAKKKALSNISDWFGQVQGAEGKAASRDQSLADAGDASMADASKGIMASLGGSAMGGSGEIGAMGANDANTLSAIGASDKMLSSDLAPIFAAMTAQSKDKTQQQFRQGGQDLSNQLAAAHGQESADRANALMSILQANSTGRQTAFQNKAGLLNTLASLQISGMNSASEAQSRQIENAYKISQIQKNGQKSKGGLAAMTPMQRADFVQKIKAGLVDPNGGKLSMAWPDALRAARSTARSAGLDPFNRQVIQTIIGPALQGVGITGPGGGYWQPIFKP